MTDATWLILWAWLAIHTDTPLEPDIYEAPGFAEAVHQVAVALELAYPFECHLFERSGLDEIRRRRKNLDDCPHLSTLELFMTDEAIAADLAFARVYLSQLRTWQSWEDRQSVGRWQAWQEMIEDAEGRVMAYRLVSESRRAIRAGYEPCEQELIRVGGECDSRWLVDFREPMTTTRNGLRSLHNRLGADRYDAGILFVPVPIDRLQRVP